MATDLLKMVQPIILTPERAAIIQEIQALDARFTAEPLLRRSASGIGSAKGLINKALAAGLDSRAFHGLQIWIGMFDTEIDLPEHLRSWQPLP